MSSRNSSGSEFHEKLAKQDIKFSREIPANERRIARGEYPLYLPVSLTSIPELKGLPVKFIAPKEGLPYIGYDLALLKNAPHPNAARLLMEYYLGRKMQQGFANLGLLAGDQRHAVPARSRGGRAGEKQAPRHHGRDADGQDARAGQADLPMKLTFDSVAGSLFRRYPLGGTSRPGNIDRVERPW